jgi:hypothetical protein
MSQAAEAFAIARCPLCKASLHLQDAKGGWLDCPNCKKEVWVSSLESLSRRDRLRRLVYNFPQFFLLLGLLLASLGITALYQRFPDTSPLGWLLFSLAGLAAVIIVPRRSRRLRSSRSEVISGLKIVFTIWLLSGLLFYVADKGLSLYPFHVDQLAIRVLLVIYPLAMLIHGLPASWIPALVATLFFLVLALAGLQLADADEAPSRLMRPIYALARALNRLARFVKFTGIGKRVISVVETYSKWATVLNAASLGVLAFGLSAAVGGSSIALRHADILDAFLTLPFKAHADWTRLEGEILVSQVAAALEAEWHPPPKCSDAPGTSDCNPQSNQFHVFPPDWGRTVAFHQPPYPPPSAKPDDFPRGPPPGPNGPPKLESRRKAYRAAQVYDQVPVPPRPAVPLANADTSRGRLYDQVTASAGHTWDTISRVVIDAPPAARFERIPSDLTPAQIAAARNSFEAVAPVGPVYGWSSDLVASLFASAETGGSEAVKQLVAKAVDTQLPVGELVGELVDLFLSGPAIEHASVTTEEYVRTHRFRPIASLSEKARQAARGALSKLHQLWAFFVGADEADDRKVIAPFLRHEVGDLFDKSFAFGKPVPESDLNRARDALIDHIIPSDGSFNAETVDQIMNALSDAGYLTTPDRFEKLISLRQFGADTGPLEVLQNSELSKAAEAALNAEAPFGVFSSSELKPGWKKAIYSDAMTAWFEGKEVRRKNIMEALSSYLPSTIVCGNCVDARTHAYISGPHCIRPGQEPPCPRYGDPFNRGPFSHMPLRMRGLH